MATLLQSREGQINLTELNELNRDVKESCQMRTTFKAREQLIRFEKILRYFSLKYDLDDHYESRLFDLKLKLYRLNELEGIQKAILYELKMLRLEIKYLSKLKTFLTVCKLKKR